MPAGKARTARGSIRLRLSVGLGIICAFAVATLVFTLFWEYDITPGDLAGPDHSAAWREVRDHVILPILVLIVPTLIATAWVIDRAHLRREITAMHRLVEQLLLMAQIEAETATPQRAQGFSLAGVAEDVVAALSPQVIAQEREIALDEPAGHPAAMVWGHREAVAAALRNLVENAVRVTPPGGLVRVATGPGPCLDVTDEGPGLAPEALARLTRRHARADHASRQGAGLGLNIVERIMAAHGGTLTSDAGRRTLTLRFPTPQSRGGPAS